MIKIIKHAVNKNAWLFFAAAWVFTLSFIFTNYFSYSSSSEKVAGILSKYIKGQENSFKNILHDSASITAIISDTPTLIKKQLLSDAQGIFAYQLNDVGNPFEIFWNTNKMAPDEHDLLRPDGSYLVTYPNGIFELVKTSFINNGNNYFLVMLIPIRWQYDIQQIDFLKPHFAVNEAIDKEYEIAALGEGVPVANSEEQKLFAIKEIHQKYNDSPTGFSIFLRLIALVFLFVFINNIAIEIVRLKNFRSGFAFLAVSMLVLRIIIFFLPIPFYYRGIQLFDGEVYSSGLVNKSLGDLLLNVLLVFWMIIFFRKKMKRSAKTALQKVPVVYKLATYLSFILIPVISFYFVELITGLIVHSNISFNAANFFSLTGYSLTGFFIICLLLYIWLYLTGLLVQLASQTNIPLFWQYITILTCSFLLISLQLFSVDSKLLLIVSAFMLLLLTFIRYRDNPSFSSLVNSSYFIVWALILTAAASALIVYQNNITEKETRIQTAKNLQEQTDSSGTFLIRLAVSNFTDDFLGNNFHRFRDSATNRFVRDSLINKNLGAYRNKYRTRIYLFDNNNQPLYNDDSISYPIINSILQNRSRPTSFKGLNMYRNQQNDYNYIYEKKIEKDSTPLGALFVVIQPKLFQNNLLSPELFKQTNPIFSVKDSGYNFGVYDKYKLISPFSGFNFSDTVTEAQIPKTGYYFTDSDGYNQLWYNAGNNKLLVIAKKNDVFSNFITLFSYLFVLFIILSFAVHNSRELINRGTKLSFHNLFRFNIRTQIQTTIVGVSILSFLIIGVATISFFIFRFKKNTDNQLINASQIIAKEIQQALKYSIINNDTDFIDFSDDDEFEKKIAEIGSIHNTDINLYAKNGILNVSSQPYIYEQQILSNRIDPEAFYQLHYNKSTRFSHMEQIGDFSFESIYRPIKDEKDETIAYLNIPSLSTQNDLKEEISDFLVTLIILNALIFIFAGAISVALTGRITSSLELIGSKMKQVKIGTANDEIPWERNDEIGLLVREFNRMVKQLGKSAEALAKTEREDAWREMARQVAHEIKNPLTPMKLSLQYLQRAMDENSPNAVELSKKLASSLVEQIDQLSKIAGDFAQFANIENTKPESFNINTLIQNLVNLYKADSGMFINFNAEETSAEIYSDKAQINRLFTNLIKNAIEAYDENETPRIELKQYMQQSDVTISVTDSGNGISEALRSKIFNPNFTTKSSGTGLGLAICKAIVENAGGRIWFTTANGQGTSFYVKLPLAKSLQPSVTEPI